jgi:hypothetical protein
MEAKKYPSVYQIRVRGHLDQRWQRWFDGFEISLDPNGETVISGIGNDQATLHGVLNRIRDLGLDLISVQMITPST